MTGQLNVVVRMCEVVCSKAIGLRMNQVYNRELGDAFTPHGTGRHRSFGLNG